METGQGGKGGQGDREKRRHMERRKKPELDTWWLVLPSTHSSPLLVISPWPQPPGTYSQSTWVCAPGLGSHSICLATTIIWGWTSPWSGPMGTRSGGFVREGELFLPVTGAMGSDHLGSLRRKPTERKAEWKAEERQVPDEAVLSPGIQPAA